MGVLIFKQGECMFLTHELSFNDMIEQDGHLSMGDDEPTRVTASSEC